MRKQLLRSFLFSNIVLALIGISSSTTTIIKADNIDTKTSQSTKKSKTSSSRTTKINHILSNYLSKNHELLYDNFNNETKISDKKIKTSKNYWANFVQKINYLKNDQLEIYVTSNFKDLSEKNRTEIIDRARLLALTHVGDFKGLTEDEHLEGLSSLIFCEGNLLGKTEYLNHAELIWNKEAFEQKN